jgi:hypothetical protein
VWSARRIRPSFRQIRLILCSGTLRPKLQKRKGHAYDMREFECHGLKELITLLTFLYDDENNCLIRLTRLA